MHQEKRIERAHPTMLITWSEEDQAFLVDFPDLAHRVMMPCAHGATYREAAQQGQEVLALLRKGETETL